MARPTKNTVDYFPHPVTDGSRMFIMEQNFGDKGYVAYYKLLGLLGKSEGHFLDFNDGKTQLFFASSIRADIELTEKIINTLAKIGAIDKTLWENERLIWCQEFVDKVAHLYGKRGYTPTKPGLIQENANHEGVEGTKTPHSIVYNSIEKNSIENNPKGLEAHKDRLQTVKDAFAEKLKPYIGNPYTREMLLDFYEYWVEPNKSLTQVKFQMQKTWDLSRRLKTWARNEQSFKNGKNTTGTNGTNYHSIKADVTALVTAANGIPVKRDNLSDSGGGN